MNELELKYGCNPNQKPSRIFMKDGSDLPIQVLNGKPGFINFLDAFNSWQLVKELKEANRKALENREEYHRSTLLDWFTSRESIFSSMNRTDTDGDCRSLVREITIRVSEQSQKLSELRKEITAYTGNFSEDNVFAFKTSFSDDKEYMDFACDLKEFIDEDKVSEYQSRISCGY